MPQYWGIGRLVGRSLGTHQGSTLLLLPTAPTCCPIHGLPPVRLTMAPVYVAACTNGARGASEADSCYRASGGPHRTHHCYTVVHTSPVRVNSPRAHHSTRHGRGITVVVVMTVKIYPYLVSEFTCSLDPVFTITFTVTCSLVNGVHEGIPQKIWGIESPFRGSCVCSSERSPQCHLE